MRGRSRKLNVTSSTTSRGATTTDGCARRGRGTWTPGWRPSRGSSHRLLGAASWRSAAAPVRSASCSSSATRTCEYVGLDLSGAMLDIARGRMGRFGSRVELRQVHGALSLEHDTYDGAFGVDVLHHVERPAVVLGEVCEALAPGGQMVFLEGNPRFPVTALLGMRPATRARAPAHQQEVTHVVGLDRRLRRDLHIVGPDLHASRAARDRTCARPRRRPLRAGTGSEDVGAPHRRGRAQASSMTYPSHGARRVRPRKSRDVRREAARPSLAPVGRAGCPGRVVGRP